MKLRVFLLGSFFISACFLPSLSAANRFWFFFNFYFLFLIKDLFFMTVKADILEDWAAQSFNQIGENYHSATISYVVTTGIQWSTVRISPKHR